MQCKDNSTLMVWIDIIKTHGELTGTSCYGPITDESDIDYVMVEKKVNQYTEFLGLKVMSCAKYACEFMSFKYRPTMAHRWINLIVVPDELALNAWIYATNKMTVIHNKNERRFVFGKLLNEFFRNNHSSDRAKWIEVKPDKW